MAVQTQLLAESSTVELFDLFVLATGLVTTRWCRKQVNYGCSLHDGVNDSMTCMVRYGMDGPGLISNCYSLRRRSLLCQVQKLKPLQNSDLEEETLQKAPSICMLVRNCRCNMPDARLQMLALHMQRLALSTGHGEQNGGGCQESYPAGVHG